MCNPAKGQGALPTVPITFSGYVTKDRWDQSVIYNGQQEVFLSDDSMKQIAGKTNIPVTLSGGVYKESKDDVGLITEVQTCTKIKVPAFNFTMTAASTSVKQGAGLPVHIQVYNGSASQLTLDPYSLTVVFVAQDISQYTDKAALDSTGRPLWPTFNNFSNGGPSNGELQAYCSTSPINWNPMRYFLASDGVVIGPSTPNHSGSGTYRTLIVQPHSTVVIDDTIGQWLQPGQYEVFLHRNRDGEFCPDTKRLPLDVVKQ